MRNLTVKQLMLTNIALLAVGTASLVVSLFGLTISGAALRAAAEPVVVYAGAEAPAAEEEPPVGEITSAELVPEPEEEDGADLYREDIPLSRELQTVLRESCAQNDIPFEVGVGLIDAESEFDATAVSPSGCYGLCQLNPRYFPKGLSSEENIRVGMAYLGEQLVRYKGDMAAALQSYHDGHDTGKRWYADLVLSNAGYWRDTYNDDR